MTELQSLWLFIQPSITGAIFSRHLLPLNMP